MVKLHFGLEMNSGCMMCVISAVLAKPNVIALFLFEWLDVTKLTFIQTLPCVLGGTSISSV